MPSIPAPLAAPLPPPRNPDLPYRVCLVCMGNICRSPMAETVVRAGLNDAGLSEVVRLDSAGTGDWHAGEAMYPQARGALARRGYDGSGPESPGRHRARQFQASWLGDRDLVLAMDASNLAALRRLAGLADRDRIRLFGEVGGLGLRAEIPDPYGGTEADFDYVLDLLDAAAPVIAVRLAELLGRPGDDDGGDGDGDGDGDPA
jgi:protein-tyrosine phosphatase